MGITYTSPLQEKPGLITEILERNYKELAVLDVVAWREENAEWWTFEKEIFQYPHAIGACVFLTWYDGRPAGFGSYNPRLGPGLGMVGHNCIIPEFRGRGLGKKQTGEILKRLQSMGVKMARVSTSSHSFFIPAQRMYVSCGFTEIGRRPWNSDPPLDIIEYEKNLADETKRRGCRKIIRSTKIHRLLGRTMNM